MAIRFFRNRREGGTEEISLEELFELGKDYQLRKLAFDTCVNMVGSALGLCEFRTFANGKETFEAEHYLWNIEPNVNQNSTMFLHKLVGMLFLRNEALIVETRKKNGESGLVVADDWTLEEFTPARQNEYSSVTVDQYSYNKTFKEQDVIHLKLHNRNVKGLVDDMANRYAKLMTSFEAFYDSNRGNRWKVHINQLAAAGDNGAEKLKKQIAAAFKPFVTSGNALLPETDGLEYTKIPSAAMGADGTTELRALTEDVFNYTARAFQIPVVLINGKVEATADAHKRFLTDVIDPICDQLQEEITRKRYGFEQWSQGNKMLIDSSGIVHFDLFEAAANIEKLVGSGVFTVNDVRRAAGQPTIDEEFANIYYMTRNFATTDEMLKGVNNE